MILTWRYVNIIILLIFVNTKLSIQNSEFSLGYETINTKNPSDWRFIEALAEEHPYVVALLSSMKDYVCTGSIINKFCIITSGNCITYEPKYAAVNTAVYSKKVNKNSIFNITETIIHGDFIFQLKTADPNDTRMHSNIGLVYVDRPFLEFFINVADLGNFYASELTDKLMTAVGYGSLGSSNQVTLQYQIYQQTPCMNPKWYYCVCGIETRTKTKTYLTEFGNGGPAVLESKIVGILAAASGILYMKNLDIKYNVFTVTGPYVPWIEKFKLPERHNESEYFRSNKGVSIEQSMFLKHIHTLLMISKMFF